jgi:hypothetical protein
LYLFSFFSATINFLHVTHELARGAPVMLAFRGRIFFVWAEGLLSPSRINHQPNHHEFDFLNQRHGKVPSSVRLDVERQRVLEVVVGLR